MGIVRCEVDKVSTYLLLELSQLTQKDFTGLIDDVSGVVEM